MLVWEKGSSACPCHQVAVRGLTYHSIHRSVLGHQESLLRSNVLKCNVNVSRTIKNAINQSTSRAIRKKRVWNWIQELNKSVLLRQDCCFGRTYKSWPTHPDHPTLLCLSAASSRVCNGGQRPYTEGGNKPTWESPAPCSTASARSSSHAMWGKASPTQPLLAGTQTPPSWSHPGLQNFQRRSWSYPIWILPPPTPSRSMRAHLPITARTKPSSTKERCLFCPGGEILEQTSSTPRLGTHRFYLRKTVGPSLVRNLPSSTCLTSVPIHWQLFSILLPQTIYVFP